MTSLILSAQIVVPMFLLMGLGVFLRLRGLLEGKALEDLNNLCFQLFLPISLFRNIYQVDLRDLPSLRLLAFGAGVQLVMLAVLLLVIPRLVPDAATRGSTAHAVFRSNFILFGLILAEGLATGPRDLAVVSVLAAVMIPLSCVGGVVLLEKYRGGRTSVQQVLRKILTNPFVVSSALGFVLLLLGVRVPTVVDKAVEDLARVATPLSLLALGAWFQPGSLARYRRELLVGTVGRLLVAPGVFLPLCIWAGFRDAELLGLTCMLIAPTAVSTFNMAQQMEADGQLAGLLIIVQSAVSVVTMFGWIFLLGSLGLLAAAG